MQTLALLLCQGLVAGPRGRVPETGHGSLKQALNSGIGSGSDKVYSAQGPPRLHCMTQPMSKLPSLSTIREAMVHIVDLLIWTFSACVERIEGGIKYFEQKRNLD